jgi:hypothetical protein
LVVELQAKRLEIPEAKIPPKVSLAPPATASPTYHQNSVEDWFYTSLMR